MDTVVLELQSVTKAYPGSPPVYALRGVDLQIRSGELAAIIGPSGSGKTTLLHMMGALDNPSGGTVRIAGESVTSLSDNDLALLRARQIGIVFQQFFLDEHSTLLENVATGLLYSGVRRDERERLAHDALAMVGLADRHGAKPTQLSGGQRERVAIARALAGQPAIILADEPTGNLDTQTGESILALIHDLNAQGVTIVMVTHDLEIARRCGRQIEIRDGRVLADSGGAA